MRHSRTRTSMHFYVYIQKNVHICEATYSMKEGRTRGGDSGRLNGNSNRKMWDQQRSKDREGANVPLYEHCHINEQVGKRRKHVCVESVVHVHWWQRRGDGSLGQSSGEGRVSVTLGPQHLLSVQQRNVTEREQRKRTRGTRTQWALCTPSWFKGDRNDTYEKGEKRMEEWRKEKEGWRSEKAATGEESVAG